MSDTQLVPPNLATYAILNLHDHLGIQVDKFETLHRSNIDRMLTDAGWTVISGPGRRSTSDLEKRTAIALTAYGLMPPLVVQEHKIGRFSADFAVPSVRVVIEVDGIHHLSPDVANKDIRKDVYLASEGWKVYRVDCTGGAEAKSSIGLRIGEIVDDILSSNFQEVRRTYDSPQEISKMASRAQVNAISERLS